LRIWYLPSEKIYANSPDSLVLDVYWQVSGFSTDECVVGSFVEKPETLATAIRIGNPASWETAEAARDESGGSISIVTDDEIVAAYQLIAAKEGVFCEPASAASVAGLMKLAKAGKVEPGSTVVCVLTGHGLKDPDNAIKFGQKHTQTVLQLIEKIITEVGQAKIDPMPKLTGEEKTSLDKINSKVKNYITTDKLKAIFTYQQKEELGKNITAAKEELDALLKADNEISKDERKKAVGSVDDFIDSHLRLLILEKGERPDGRKMDEIRQLSAEVGVLPRTHGSGLFQRGETQVLSIVTLGSPSMEQTLDTMEESSKKRYMHHYNFPPFSVGETGVLRGPGRREIGHGALAEKALVPMLPAKEDFPYTIRVVSEVLSSNGSSSQASICGSTLSLMDAGVPIKKPVAGIAMGLITDNNNIDKYRILTDIQGFEDHSGDMDFNLISCFASILPTMSPRSFGIGTSRSIPASSGVRESQTLPFFRNDPT